MVVIEIDGGFFYPINNMNNNSSELFVEGIKYYCMYEIFVQDIVRTEETINLQFIKDTCC